MSNFDCETIPGVVIGALVSAGFISAYNLVIFVAFVVGNVLVVG